MKYRFPGILESDFSAIKKFIKEKQEITKEELLEKCTGKIDLDLLQNLKSISFSVIGKDENGELYLK